MWPTEASVTMCKAKPLYVPMMQESVLWLKSLKATRAYRPEPIKEDHLNEILQAGRWTGSSLNAQPWTFVVVTHGATKAALSKVGRFSPHLADAAVVVVLVGDPGRGEFDLGRVAQSMMLAADALGVGSCPATLHDSETTHQILGIPDDRPARHAIAFGYPDAELESTIRQNMSTVTGPARKPLEGLVRWEKFD